MASTAIPIILPATIFAAMSTSPLPAAIWQESSVIKGIVVAIEKDMAVIDVA